LATASVPPRTSVPLDVIGPPVNVRPVDPPEASTLVTVPPVGGGATTSGATRSFSVAMPARASLPIA
jgi:hypothetical protein